MKGRVTPRPYKLVDGERRPIKGRSTWTYEFAVTRAGKRKFVNKGGFRTKADAESALAVAMAEHGRDPGREPVKPSVMPLRDFIDREWMPALVNLKPTTIRSYRDLADIYVIPTLGDDRLCDITPGRLVGLYGALRTTGRKRKPGGLAESTIHHVHVMLTKLFGYAVETGAIVASPMARIAKDSRPRAPKADPDKLKVWTREQTRKFLAATVEHRDGALWRLAIDSGMRRGELAALRWGDVDLEQCVLVSKRNRVVVGSEVIEGTRKTGKGLRITIAPATATALKAHRKRQLEERLAWGEAWQDGDYVFTREDGSPMHPSTLARQLRALVDVVGVPHIGVHGMRHSCATLALDAGVPLKTVSDRLGHSSIAITADIYTHGSDEQQADAAARIMSGLG